MSINSSVAYFWDKFIALVEKLPGGLQKPIIRELTPVREMFFERRAPRFLLLGSEEIPLKQIFECLSLPEHTALANPPVEVDEILQDMRISGWQCLRHGERGQVFVFDARRSCSQSEFERACEEVQPDLVIVLNGRSTANAEEEARQVLEETQELIKGTQDLLKRLNFLRREGQQFPVVGIATSGESADVVALNRLLIREGQIDRAMMRVFPWLPGQFREVTLAICGLLPNQSRLEFARFSDARQAQAFIAHSLLKSFSAICGVIGVQPIPLADLPILTSIQSLMVALIAYISGRSMNARTVAEFMGALGFNVGAGILFREGARALVKILPLWGNAISGLVAGAGTYAIGKAAIAYFIDNRPAAEARRIFRRLAHGKKNSRESIR